MRKRLQIACESLVLSILILYFSATYFFNILQSIYSIFLPITIAFLLIFSRKIKVRGVNSTKAEAEKTLFYFLLSVFFVFYGWYFSSQRTLVIAQTTPPPPQPDLVIEDIGNVALIIFYRIKNQGVTIAGPSYSRLWVDGVYKADDYVGSLGAGASSNEYFATPWICSGTNDTIKVCADATNVVSESNEGNNCREETWICPFDFSISVSPSSGSVAQGGSTTTTVTLTLIAGTTTSVSLSCLNLPSGASCSFSPPSCNPTCSSTLTISTATTTPPGTYPITVRGIGGGVTRDTTYTLTVTFTFKIYPEWNLISIPFDKIERIKSDDCNVFSRNFYYFNATKAEWEVALWSQLVGGKGYWIRSPFTGICNVEIAGSGMVELADIPPLRKGYNMIGTTSSLPFDMNAIRKIGCTKITEKLYWDALAKKWETETGPAMVHGRGYWVYCS